ncbi:MAG: UvrD-helicase domain-containing protein [Betaproteobacteria bacterium]|nr:UvrD-helicase domain-containing protein [Betaproteobacteria bacterium]
MMPADRLLFGLELTDRQMAVGDVVTHPEYGEGTLRGGWEGHLQVDFPSGAVSFSDHDDVCLIESPRPHHWQLVSRAEVDANLAEFQKRRRDALTHVRTLFATNFLGADRLFNQASPEHLTFKEYEEEKIRFVQRWMEENLPSQGTKPRPLPDEEQALAIATVGCHVQLSARAGSGKTETVANRAVFLQRHCDIAPAEMLLLAFNRDAAREMAERLKSKLCGASLPHVMTFHALAYALVPGAKTLLVNAADGSDQSLNEEFQQVLLDAMQHPQFETARPAPDVGTLPSGLDSIIRGDSTSTVTRCWPFAVA